MSEYLSKKAVLEWLDDRRYKSPWDELDREVQRLRAVLERIKKWADDPEPVTMLKIRNLANETLKGDENNA